MKRTESKTDGKTAEREELERKNREQIDTSLTGGDDALGRPAAAPRNQERRWPGRRDVT